MRHLVLVGVLMCGLSVTACRQETTPPQAQSTAETELSTLRQQAESGDADAQYILGGAYALGQGVPQDYTQAVAWVRQAAEQGHADAQNSLGAAYANGEGVPQDDAQAVTWTRKAAEQGLADAQSNLGVMYELGRGVPQDFVSAHLYYNLAASRATGDDQTTYAESRDRVAAEMTPQHIAAAQKLALEWTAAFEQRQR